MSRRVCRDFNNVPKQRFVYRLGNEESYIKVPIPEQESQLNEYDRNLAAAETSYAALQPEIAGSQRAWETWIKASHVADWNVPEGLILHFSRDGNLPETTGLYERHNSFRRMPEGSSKAQIQMTPISR